MQRVIKEKSRQLEKLSFLSEIGPTSGAEI